MSDRDPTPRDEQQVFEPEDQFGVDNLPHQTRTGYYGSKSEMSTEFKVANNEAWRRVAQLFSICSGLTDIVWASVG